MMNSPSFQVVRPPVPVQPLLRVRDVNLEYRTAERTVRATHDAWCVLPPRARDGPLLD